MAKTLREIFAERLDQALKERGKKQKELATYLDCSQALVTSWIKLDGLPTTEDLVKIRAFLEMGLAANESRYSLDWLMGLTPGQSTVREHDGFRWVEGIPDYINTPASRDFIQLGIDFFHMFLEEDPTPDDLRRERYFNHDWSYLTAAFLAALQANALRLIKVPRSKDKEAVLCETFKLNPEWVRVVKIPHKNLGSLIRAEFVNFLAVNDILPMRKGQQRVGLSSGHTLLRFAMSSIPSEQFNGTQWIPLEVGPNEEGAVYGANHIAMVMAARHMGSHALYFPYTRYDSSEREKKVCANLLDEAESITTIFLSVNGAGRRPQESQYLENQFQTANHIRIRHLHEQYQQLVDEKRHESLAGLFLGLMLDDDARVLIQDQEALYQISLKTLHSIEAKGMVCIIAARNYKARCVQMALGHKLANAICIDEEIADRLIAGDVYMR